MVKEIEIQYCTSWNYLPKAASLADEILSTFKQDISRLVLVPSDGGRFEVSFDGELAFSKLAEQRFPEHQEIIAKIKWTQLEIWPVCPFQFLFGIKSNGPFVFKH